MGWYLSGVEFANAMQHRRRLRTAVAAGTHQPRRRDLYKICQFRSEVPRMSGTNALPTGGFYK